MGIRCYVHRNFEDLLELCMKINYFNAHTVQELSVRMDDMSSSNSNVVVVKGIEELKALLNSRLKKKKAELKEAAACATV